MIKSILITFALLFFILFNSIGQKKNVVQPELDTGSIEKQFDYIISKSTKYKEFQLIRRTSILKVKTHVLDSLKTVRKEIKIANTKVNSVEEKLIHLKNNSSSLQLEIDIANKKIDNISFLGIALSKSTYNIVVWSIITILLVGLLFIFFQYKNSSNVTKRTKNELFKIENELEAFRKKSLKKEQEIMRKLQNEINKNTP